MNAHEKKGLLLCSFANAKQNQVFNYSDEILHWFSGLFASTVFKMNAIDIFWGHWADPGSPNDKSKRSFAVLIIASGVASKPFRKHVTFQFLRKLHSIFDEEVVLCILSHFTLPREQAQAIQDWLVQWPFNIRVKFIWYLWIEWSILLWFS